MNFDRFFGDRYRLGYDPACGADSSLKKDPFYRTLECRSGTLSPQGQTTLRLETPAKSAVPGKIRERLGQRVSIVKLSDVAIVLFDLAEFESIADLIRPRKKRRLSEAQRAECVERLRRVRPSRSKTPTPDGVLVA